MSIISREVLSVSKVLSQELVNPDYQRPYKWRAKHVNQLLETLSTIRLNPVTVWVRLSDINKKAHRIILLLMASNDY